MPIKSSHNSLWHLMARSLSGEAAVEEERELQDILQNDVALMQQFELLKRMWQKEWKYPSTTDDCQPVNISRILQKATNEHAHVTYEEYLTFQQRARRRRLWYTVSTAAAVLLIFSGVWYFNRNQNGTENLNGATQTLSAGNGSRTHIILPDGSTVWLNAGSEIVYNKKFSDSTRDVTLLGEAYFDVVKQPQRPFIVHVADYDIRVLGTAFNVKSYATDKTVETTLIHGLVEVTRQGIRKQKPIYLYPNEKLIMQKVAANIDANLPDKSVPANNEERFTVKHLDSSVQEKDRIETAWVFNRLEFKDDSFEELAAKLERWYDVTIVFDDEDAKKLNFHGSFETETVEQALTALAIATPFSYVVKGRDIHIKITKKKSK